MTNTLSKETAGRKHRGAEGWMKAEWRRQGTDEGSTEKVPTDEGEAEADKRGTGELRAGKAERKDLKLNDKA